MSWRPVPTVENHRELHTPDLGCGEEAADWEWPFWKFGFPNPQVLFNELHAEYNSIQCAIQDPYGWYFDVCEIAKVANNREQFLTLLRNRRDERYSELQKSWDRIATYMVGEPDRWDTPPDSSDLWMRFIRISRSFSYDTFVAYFGAHFKDDDEPSTSKPPIEPGSSNQLQMQQEKTRLEIEGRAKKTVETTPENPRAGPSSDSTPGFRMQKTQIGLEEEEHASTGETRPEQSHPKPEMVDRSTQTTEPRTRTAAAKRRSGQGTKSPNRVVKRQAGRSKPATSNPEGLRRSARLKERAARAS